MLAIVSVYQIFIDLLRSFVSRTTVSAVLVFSVTEAEISSRRHLTLEVCRLDTSILSLSAIIVNSKRSFYASYRYYSAFVCHF